jgi:hypothetical protein
MNGTNLRLAQWIAYLQAQIERLDDELDDGHLVVCAVLLILMSGLMAITR